ncbi:MAG: NYN domain-containing protein [Candidatus Sulfomarinibacteraceae bacterium]
MPILLDGNNLLHRLPRSQRTRAEVRKQVLDITRRETVSVTVVFDGPPPAGAPPREALGKVTVIYSGSRAADDVILSLLPPGSAATQWSVVTDDRGLATRVKDRGAKVRRLAEWRGRRPQKAPLRARVESKLSSNEVAEWESFFADRPEDEA